MTAEEQYAEIVRDAMIATVDAQRDHAVMIDRYADHNNPVAASAYTVGMKKIIDQLTTTAAELGVRAQALLDPLGASGCSVTVGYPWGIQVSLSWDRRADDPDVGTTGQHAARPGDVR